MGAAASDPPLTPGGSSTRPVPSSDEADIDSITRANPAPQEPDNPDFTYPERLYGDPPTNNHTDIDTLIIVCCHAIFHASPSDSNFPLHSPTLESNWHLAPFQQSNARTAKPGEHTTFLAHITRGLDLLSTSPTSLLVFSGGHTKPTLTSLSEAQSYYNAALAQALSHSPDHAENLQTLFDQHRILLEERATDSFQNLLFSLQLFRQQTGRDARHVLVITHAFKTQRFLKLHAQALGWAGDRIRVEGINPPFSADELDEVVRGEERACREWEEDALGEGEVLGAKRRARGWVEYQSSSFGEV
ncbi:hypothetical protein EJ04DRAFT_431780 [Polyplosphaeria fusca]|uniref:DUF218 domain-containing protein n=1 Tax=Polyplosphaeria fusca TaxID=682080 RepID=A0A9P4V243_9PLEO|nr:hypothetical protein EJ04DRAFT_431780 [Polyplosphaeria fusca]